MEQTFGRWLRGDPPPLLPRVASAQLLPRVPSTTKLSTSGARGTSTRSRWWGGSAGAARILAAAVAIFLSVHIAALLLGSQPVVPATPATWTDLQLDGDSMAAGGYDIPGPPTTPRLMPRIIHQLFNGSLERPEGAADAYRAWRQVNPGWELRFYDLNERAAYVRRWFPEYVGAYDALSSDAERKDLFRYLALLRHGGVFADGLGTETPPQLEDVLTATDTLVVGWDQEFPSAKAAIDSCRVRQRQLQHGVLAAAPGHPALKEVCDRVAANLGASSSGHPILDALERTGPGVLTDSVLAFAEEHARTDKSGPWGVRILSQSAFGVPGATPCDRLLEETSATSAGHGANRAREGGRASHWWPFKGHYGGAEVAEGSSMQPPAPLSGIVGAYVGSIEAQRAEERLYPVSAVFDPPYEMMTHLIGHGDRQSGSDVSASITQHGAWQPSVQPWRRPTLTEALVGSLGAVSGKGGALIDVGAGYGTISLAAAARGHRVHAFELSARSVEALEASIERNGFGGLIDVHKVALGAPSQRGTACLALHANATWARAATAAAAAADLARGYSNPAAHAVDASACARRIPRLPGSEAVPTGVRVGAIRLSANGWEGFVLDGLLPLIQRQRPPVIAVEWNPTAMLAAGHTAPLDVVHRLVALGYADVSHSGFMCDERWYAITYGVRRRGGMVPEEIAGLKQPTWCRLLPGEYHVLLDKADGKYPETLLFINKESGKAGGHQSRSDRGTGGGESGVAAAEHASAHDAAKAVESLSAAEDVGSLPEGTDAGHMRDSELEVPRMKR